MYQIDKRKWWNQLDDNWKNVFKEKMAFTYNYRGVTGFLKKRLGVEQPSEGDLENIFNLPELYCDSNQIRDLEPLRAMTNLQNLVCWGNQISDLEPLRALRNLQNLVCWDNQISDLKPLRTLMNLQELNCDSNQINDLELGEFKKAVPNCYVSS